MQEVVETYNDPFSSYTIDRRYKALRLRWLSTTEAMTEEQFRSSLILLPRIIEREHLKNILFDVREFCHESPNDFIYWHEAHVVPKYNDLKLLKFAFLVPKGSEHTVENGVPPERVGNARYETAYFSSDEDAFAWFGEKRATIGYA